MEIAIIGYGRMGREVERLAKERGHRARSIIDPVAARSAEQANRRTGEQEKLPAREPAVYCSTALLFKEITPEALQGVDVAIEFTSPEAAVANIEKVAKLGVNMVVGTTGWYEKLERVREVVEEAGIGFVYAPNFAIGVNVFYEIVKSAAKLFDRLEDYDVFCHETHHSGKVDSPSGTAKKMAEILLEEIRRKEAPVYESLKRRRQPGELHVSSTRGGWVPGTHEVVFDSEFDSVEIVHRARSRGGLAAGALRAAEWVRDKKGFCDFSDFLREMLEL